MKLYYITLNNTDEARQIGRALLEQKLAVCVNWFPITCAYVWQGEISEEPEVVLIGSRCGDRDRQSKDSCYLYFTLHIDTENTLA